LDNNLLKWVYYGVALGIDAPSPLIHKTGCSLEQYAVVTHINHLATRQISYCVLQGNILQEKSRNNSENILKQLVEEAL
jgi:hypothetical protein